MAGQGGKNESSFLDSINEVCKILSSQSQAVVKIIAEDVLKQKKLKPFVDQYLKSTDETLNFFKTVEKCVAKAKINQRLIQVAIERLVTESLADPALSPNGPNMDFQSRSWLKSAFSAVNRFSLDTDFEGHKKNKYAETLEKLKKVKAMEDPFGDEFETQYESVYTEQVMLLVKIRELQVMLEKKLKNAKIWRGVGVGFFVTALLSRIVLSIIGLHHGGGGHGGGHTFGADMMHSHAVLTQATEILSSVVEMTSTLTGILLKDYEKDLKTRKDLSQLTGHSTNVNIQEMETIKGLVDALITRMSSILETEEVAAEKREEEAVRLVMQEIIKNVEGFAEKIEEVGANVAECSKSVVTGRDLVLKHIANH